MSSQALDDALALVSTGLDALVDAVDSAELGRIGGDGVLRFAQEIEALRNRISLIDHAVVGECDRQALAQSRQARSTTGLLAQVLRISTAVAGRRVAAAHACAVTLSVTGAVVPPVRPHVAAAQRVGGIGAEQATVIIAALSGLDRAAGIDPAELDRAESTLVGHARVFGPRDLHRLAERLTDALCPDGTLAAETARRDRRYLHLVDQPGGGAITGRLTSDAFAALQAVLNPLAQPRPTDPAGPDPRSHGQRLHDALADAATRLLRSGTLPISGGTTASIIVRVDSTDLIAGSGIAHTTGGATLTIREVLRYAGEAELIPAYLNDAGGILGYGRTRRVPDARMTTALIARDGGCSFPTCDIPPEWCERHHTIPWAEGGLTDLDNLTLVCSYHHRRSLGDGWTTTMSPVGIPQWIPPPWIDPDQRPLTHHRIAQQTTPAA